MAILKISELVSQPKINDDDLILITRPGTNFVIKFSDFKKSLPALTKEALGLDRVENFSSADLPLSKAAIDALGFKADKSHRHPVNEIDGLELLLADKANKIHTHGVSDVVGLSGIIDGINKTIADLSKSVNPDINNLLNDLSLNFQALGRRVLSLEQTPKPTYEITEINGLSNALTSLNLKKADIAALEALQNSFTDLSTRFANKTYSVDDITGLRDIINTLAFKSHVHKVTDIENFEAAVRYIVETTKHTHEMSDITGLLPALEATASKQYVLLALESKANITDITVACAEFSW